MNSRIALIIIVVSVLLSGCSISPRLYSKLDTEEPHWFLSSAPKPRGVFLVVHGLNIRPSALDPLSSFLAQEGFHSYRMTLTGHNQLPDQLFDEQAWISDVAQAYHRVRERWKGLPVYILGYSLGGLLATHVVSTIPSQEHPAGMILLAPAISLRSVIDVASFFHLPPPLALGFPNPAPRAYRRYRLTPIYWYSNTLAAYRQIQSLASASTMEHIPTLIVLNPRDELVSQRGTSSWVEENHLSERWKIALVRPKVSSPLLAEHLIIDEMSLGREEWARLGGILRAFLSSN